VALCLAALPQLVRAEPKYDRPPDWLRKPSPNDLIALWPRDALARGINGRAVIHCKVSEQGALFDCTVVEESPAGAGFGQAGLALTPQFLMRPGIKDGKPVPGGEVTIPLNFTGLTRGQGLPGRTSLTISYWYDAPTYAEVAATYPARARTQKAGGHVTLNCSLKKDARLGDCDIAMEEPRGLGFGEAARKLASRFKGPLTLQDGKSTKGLDTQVPITFAPEMLADGPPMTGHPHWTATPTVGQMAGLLPKGPRRTEALTVRVMLDCAVVAEGHVDDCKVESETPSGQGYGETGVAMSKFFAMTIWTSEGLPTVGGRVRIPIRYDLPAEPADPPPAKP